MPASVSGLVPPLKWHGGKHYLAGRIVTLMPPHTHYVEPYAGGLAVLLAKSPDGVSEVVNDLDRRLTNFWKVLQDEAMFLAFHRLVEAIPFSEPEWHEAREALAERQPSNKDEMVGQAAAFFVVCRQSLAGRMKGFASLSRRRTRRSMNEQASAWITAVDGLPAVHARLRRVAVLCRPAVDVLRSQDGPGTLFYLDPPYLEETRSVPEVYGFEMSRTAHCELLEVIRMVHGKVMLSGYPSMLYDSSLGDWSRHTFDLPNNAAAGKSKDRETEVLWCNF
ncbi:MAG TPA: DNA adenine methylase [Gemmataceae bacterium]|jgi:DNA adenine methylase|nr:DNA adenine methylase [Gemmataceae bacterium]